MNNLNNGLNDIVIGALAKPRARNAARMAEISGPHFNAAYEKGLMGVSCRVGDYRRIEIASTGQQVVDYTRCGYLNLDSHPRVLAAAHRHASLEPRRAVRPTTDGHVAEVIRIANAASVEC